jgi:hypothetical protein
MISCLFSREFIAWFEKVKHLCVWLDVQLLAAKRKNMRAAQRERF